MMIRVSGTVPVRYDTATTVQYRIRDQGERFYSSSFFLVSVQTFFSTCNIHFFWLIVICDLRQTVFSFQRYRPISRSLRTRSLAAAMRDAGDSSIPIARRKYAISSLSKPDDPDAASRFCTS